MVAGIGEPNTHLPALQQPQRVIQPTATESNAAEDPNRGNRNKDLKDEAVRQHVVDEAAKREDRGQELNISV
jgi:hypothetical protein